MIDWTAPVLVRVEVNSRQGGGGIAFNVHIFLKNIQFDFFVLLSESARLSGSFCPLL